MDKQEIINTIAKYQNDELSPQERAKLLAWYNHYAKTKPRAEFPGDIWIRQISSLKSILGAETGLETTEPVQLRPYGKKSAWVYSGIAAAIMTMVFGAGLFYFNNRKAAGDVAPGRLGATLTLANGKKIHLSDAANGQLVKETGVTITKTKDGQLVYEVFDKTVQSRNEATTYNTLSTANGEQYMVILPDLTKVWLNAASSIKFPATFTGLNKRKIELHGEAYFQVKHHSKQPFLVVTKDQIVEDIGTAFNINSYDDEVVVKTTLVEGSARVSSFPKPDAYTIVVNDAQLRKQSPNHEKQASVILKPNQQSTLSGQNLQVSQVDPQDAIAWKNGDIVFDNESLESILRKIARWYNVNIVYSANVPKDLTMTGSISRSQPLSAVLEIMEKTKKVKFKIEGRRIMVNN